MHEVGGWNETEEVSAGDEQEEEERGEETDVRGSDRDSGPDTGEEEAPNISTVECESDGGGHVHKVRGKKGESHTKKRKPGKRRYVWCPIDGCLSGPVQKLTQHLYQVHKLPPHKVARLNTPENRRYAPLDAVQSKTPCPPRRQRTLHALLQRHMPPSVSRAPSSPSTSQSVPTPRKGKGTQGKTSIKAKTPAATSTRRMGYHKTDSFLDTFTQHLQSRTGGKRSHDAAAQLCKNLSKYLFFLDKESVRPELLLKKKPLVEYLRVVEEGYGVGCSGLLQKLDAITAALKFMKFSCIDEEGEEETDGKIERMLQFITQQRKSYKVGKVRSERVRLEELAADPPDLSGIAEFITDPSLTEEFIATTDKILDAPPQATRKEYRYCLAILAGRILYRYGKNNSLCAPCAT